MAFNSTETPDDEESARGSRGGEASPWARAKQAASTLANRDSNGSAAILAGVVMLVWMVRTQKRSRGRALLQGLAGAALLKYGVGKRRSRDGTSAGDRGFDRDVDVDKEESDEAYAHRERSDVMGQAESNPRGTSGEPDVETETDPEEGSIQFTEEQGDESGSEPHLEEDARDPRMANEDDEVEIDLSEASMADEASEATGPSPEQAQPASTEGTEPEPTPAEDASHMQADVPDEGDSEDSTDDSKFGTDEAGDDESEDDETVGSD